MHVQQVSNVKTKLEIARTILEGLPDWFEVKQAREDYISDSANQVFFAIFNDQHPIGFLCLKKTKKDTIELAVMGILKEYHRQKAGKKLFFEAKKWAYKKGYAFLQVKTVVMGKYNEYDQTNHFYLSVGFKELEVIETLWDKDNPCQIYVMSLNG